MTLLARWRVCKSRRWWQLLLETSGNDVCGMWDKDVLLVLRF